MNPEEADPQPGNPSLKTSPATECEQTSEEKTTMSNVALGLGVKGGEKTSCSNKHSTRDSANAKEPLVALDILRAIDNDLAASHPVLLASIDTVYPDPVLQTARRGTRTCAGVSW